MTTDDRDFGTVEEVSDEPRVDLGGIVPVVEGNLARAIRPTADTASRVSSAGRDASERFGPGPSA